MAFQVSWHPEGDRAGPKGGRRLMQIGQSVTVGREDGADIVLVDPSISRVHAEIIVESGGVQLRDRQSANGVRLAGKKIVKQTVWQPGQPVLIGKFVFELIPVQSDTQAPEILQPVRRPAPVPSRMHEPVPRGRVQLANIYKSAIGNDKQAVKEMFADFLGRNEPVVDCGYLGTIGFVFPEHSFWCVTNSRVCGMMVNRGGWVQFNFGFIKTLDRGVFIQPSLVLLWLWVLAWVVFVGFLALGAWGWAYLMLTASGWGVAHILSLLLGLAVAAAGIALLPWVVRAFYRWVKSGCIFWTKEWVPIVIPSDRNSLRDAQRFISVYSDQKRALDE